MPLASLAAFGSTVEKLGVLRGLPQQTLKLSRRRCGLLMNSARNQDGSWSPHPLMIGMTRIDAGSILREGAAA
jgi:hypothetical protein